MTPATTCTSYARMLPYASISHRSEKQADNKILIHHARLPERFMQTGQEFHKSSFSRPDKKRYLPCPTATFESFLFIFCSRRLFLFHYPRPASLCLTSNISLFRSFHSASTPILSFPLLLTLRVKRSQISVDPDSTGSPRALRTPDTHHPRHKPGVGFYSNARHSDTSSSPETSIVLRFRNSKSRDLLLCV